jgi:hypothetical protein
MIRTISSLKTFFLKYVFTASWIGLFGFATIGLWMTDGPGASQDHDLKLLSPFIWILGGGYLWWGYGTLKRVRMDEFNLYISNYLTEIEVPLGEVEEVSGDLMAFSKQVTIKFRNETLFGKKIVFLPKVMFLTNQRWTPTKAPHPIVSEIQAAVEKAKKVK